MEVNDCAYCGTKLSAEAIQLHVSTSNTSPSYSVYHCFVRCLNCGMAGPCITGIDRLTTYDTAILAWNSVMIKNNSSELESIEICHS